MYLGLLFLLTAWAVYLGTFLALAPLVLFILYMDRFQKICLAVDQVPVPAEAPEPFY